MKKLFLIPLFAGVFSVTAFSQPKKTDTIVLTSKNLVTLAGVVEGETTGKVIQGVKKLDAKGFVKNNDPIILFLNTPGGDVQAGLELNEALKGISRPVKTITLFAASMGFQIVQNQGERLILKNGTLMSHHARGGVQGEFGGQPPSQLARRIGFWEDRLNEMDRQTVERTNGKQTMETYQKAYENELWLTGEQAVDQGYADRVVTVKCDDSLEGTESHEVNFLGIPITYDTDKCPINTAITNVRMKVETTKGLMLTDDFIKKGGKFGAECLVNVEVDKLCTLDTTMNYAKIQEVKTNFVNHVIKNQRQVVYMSF